MEDDKRNKAANTIQRYYRGYRDRQQVKELREQQRHSKAAVIIQSQVRGYLARRQFEQLRKNSKDEVVSRL
ncbi:unnamed protein product [Enterobius vermicularis]|uniref:Transposase n=1 Tax=Enterobius vermicularis TaxID=51028 RepID=A0A0N4VA63_ENTVE|nr:unnamed protein product [Enterobius vermicularis]